MGFGSYLQSQWRLIQAVEIGSQNLFEILKNENIFCDTWISSQINRIKHKLANKTDEIDIVP